jgi:hypothetical protein
MKQHWLGRFTLAVAALGLLGALAPAPAAAVAQLAAPAHLQVAHIDEDSADLWWTRDTRALQEVIEFRIGDEWRTIGWDNSGFRSLTRLDRGQTYTLRMYSVPTSGSNLMRSGYSEPVTFTTLPAPDSVPPTKTSAPGFREVTTTYVDINWVPTGDNVEVTGYYLQQLVGGDFVTVRTLPSERPFTRITGLRPGTSYTFAVIAFDARGNQSLRSEPASITTRATTAAVTCEVTILPAGSRFSNSYVKLINTTPAATTGWAVQFTLPASTLAGIPGVGALSRNGDLATITPRTHEAAIQPGELLVVSIGTGGNAAAVAPSNFTLDGAPCTVL